MAENNGSSVAQYEFRDGCQIYNDRPVDNSFRGYDNVELIQIIVKAGYTNQSINFQDQAQLTGMEIQGIEAYTENDFPNSFLDQNAALPTTAQFQNAALKLYNSQKYDLNGGAYKDGVKYLPLPSLHRVDNGTDPYVRDFPFIALNRVQWIKSGLVFATAPNPGADVAYVFAVYYSSKVPTLR